MFKPLFGVSFTTYCKIKRLMFRVLHIITWNLDVENNDIRAKREFKQHRADATEHS